MTVIPSSVTICAGISATLSVIILAGITKQFDQPLFWDFPFQFAMKHPDLYCLVTNNIPMEPCCQSTFWIVIHNTGAQGPYKKVRLISLTWNKLDRPHIQMPIVLGAGTLDEAKPVGYDGDEPFFKNIEQTVKGV